MGKYVKGYDFDLYIDGPLKVAYGVFDRWYTAVRDHRSDMARNYETSIWDAANDPRRREKFILGLATYLQAQLDTGLPDKYAEIMGEVKKRQKELKREVARKVKGGTPIQQALQEIIVPV